MDQSRNRPIQNERNNISKPQIFVQLAFGVSWSQRHTPQTHTVTYMSRNLKSARDSGNFPRQVPPPNTNYLNAQEQRQNRSREHSGRHHQERQQHRHHHHAQQPRAAGQTREHGRPRGQTNEQSNEHLRARPRVGSRNEGRETLHERGRSAPPPFNDSPWDVHHASSAAPFPPFTQASREQPEGWEALPAPSSQYRLGEDGLPWSAWAWPVDDDGDESPYANNPTTVPLSTERPRSDDLERARELESLSTAMVTVDNGFENQWWYQGPRESAEPWWPREAGDEADESGNLTTAEALLLSDSEPPLALRSNEDHLASLHDLVSPMSDTSSPAQSFARPLYRSLTTRSEELWLES
ncbi:hypothetical protein F4781DRAFT_429751 [Annulohypoxylon bovei var. microspora]|nr:hypothetical protein F4781DRAFT_429751 [Annulohypoxylon bovei var. microspora]